MTKKFFFYIGISLLLFVSCNNKNTQNKKFDFGVIENSTYTNNYFKFQLSLPNNWQVLSIEDNQKLIANQTNQNQTISTAILLSLMQYELTVPDSVFNANLIVLTENISKNDRINNGMDYLMFTRKALEQQAGKREFLSKALATISLDEDEFATMKVSTEEQGVSYTQAYYTILKNGYAITYIQSYATDAQKALLDEVLASYKQIK